LPYDTPHGEAWLLKLHGCVCRQLDDIVLTRGDYLRYADRRAALAGIVQALLITRDMLFVGFSLRDPNFLRVADDVRKAVRGDGGKTWGKKLGTATLTEDDPLLRELWADDLDFAVMAPTVIAGSRNLEMFLDEAVAAATTGADHLLDPSFEGVLDEGEVALKKALQELERDVPQIARETPAWRIVSVALARLGSRSSTAGGSV
jgi:SIR2-like protein